MEELRSSQVRVRALPRDEVDDFFIRHRNPPLPAWLEANRFFPRRLQNEKINNCLLLPIKN